MNNSPHIHPTADVSPQASIGKDVRIWHGAHIREGAHLGSQCIIGKNVYIDFDVRIGDYCKIQNNSSLYHGASLEDGVFIGPHVCLTNDRYPRAITPNGRLKGNDDWEVGATSLKYGCSIGAGAIILPGVTIGRFAMIGSGSIVTHDVPDYCLAVGNPARLLGFVCACGGRVSFVSPTDAGPMPHSGEHPTTALDNGLCQRCGALTTMSASILTANNRHVTDEMH